MNNRTQQLVQQLRSTAQTYVAPESTCRLMDEAADELERLNTKLATTIRVAFDIGGVLSKHPSTFRKMVEMFQQGGIEVFVITDMPNVDEIHAMLVLNDFTTISKDHIRSADYAQFGEGCKSEILKELSIDLFFDDHLPYMVIPDHTIRCLVLPDPFKPYWHDDWKILGDNFEFGRRRYMRK